MAFTVEEGGSIICQTDMIQVALKMKGGQQPKNTSSPRSQEKVRRQIVL